MKQTADDVNYGQKQLNVLGRQAAPNGSNFQVELRGV